MRKKLIIYVLLLNISIVPLYATSEKVDSLTAEQESLQADIADSTTKINEYQTSLNTASIEVEQSTKQIEKLNDEISILKDKLADDKDSVGDLLTIMQKIDNQNSFIKYMTNDNGESLLVKFRNLVKINSLLATNLNEMHDDLVNLNDQVNQVELATNEKKQKQSEIESLLAEQQAEESNLKENLAGVDSDLLDAKEQLSIEQAQELQRQAEEEAAKEEAAAKAAEEEAAKEQAEKEAAAKAEDEQNNQTNNDDSEETVDDGDTDTDGGDIDGGDTDGGDTDGGDSIYPSNGDVSSIKNQLMAGSGISSSDYEYVDYIVTHESGWNYLISNSVSGAYGLCQALPGSKMSSSGSDWATNPQTQMNWCNSYAISSYGSWAGAYSFWQANNWW